MKRLIPYVAVIALAAAAAGCNKGAGNTAYNNSGASSTPSSTSTPATTSSTTSDSNAPAPGSSVTASTDTSSTSPSVGATAGNAVSDTVTTGKVKAALVNDPTLKDSDISVKTDGGVVVLSGTVKSQDQVAMATNLAQSQEGVSRVDSQIVVR